MRRARVRSISRFFVIVNTLLVVSAALVGGLLLGIFSEVRRALPAGDSLTSYRPRLATRIYSTERYPDGREEHTLLGRVYTEDREPEELRNLPKFLRQATIAIEDRPFYKHHGVDPKGILRAAWVNLRRGGISQGGSTITQQLARNMFLSQERTFARKLKEIILAAELERRFSKDEILEMYLNEVYYGHGAYGARRASRLYFGKEPAKLTLGECALLAGLPRSPIWYSPYKFPERARQRRRQVLTAMVSERYITRDEYKQADDEPVTKRLAALNEQGVTAFRAPYFTHLVIRMLCQMYGDKTVYEGGLDVFTTLDMRAQEIAEEELTKGVRSLRSNGSIRGGLVGQGALACVEVRTGNVISMVGGVGPYKQVQYNRAAPGVSPWGRQPGSSFKPYIWACALEHGYGPDSVFSGGPVSIPLGNGKYYSPKNYSPRQGGNFTLRNALAQSVNLVSVRLVRRLTIETVRRTAAEMLNIPIDRLRPYYSIALGANELSPLEQATGYCVFASGGLRPANNYIRRITTDRGELILEQRPQLTRVITPETAVSMIAMLRNVITSGTGGRAASVGYPAGGKTGTTNSGRDVWWVGFTPDLSAAVWVGNDDNAPMPRGSGGGFCAPIWARFMRRTMDALQLKGEFPEGAGVTASKSGEAGDEEKKLDEPQRVTICTASGGLATPYCPSTSERTVPKGGSLPSRCRTHGAHGAAGPADEPGGEDSSGGGGATVTVCAKSGLRAGASCAQTTERSFGPGQAPSGTCSSCGHSSHGGDSGGDKPKPKPDAGGDKPKPEPGGAEPAKPKPPAGTPEE